VVAGRTIVPKLFEQAMFGVSLGFHLSWAAPAQLPMRRLRYLRFFLNGHRNCALFTGSEEKPGRSCWPEKISKKKLASVVVL
jgi:hypothetical protein